MPPKLGIIFLTRFVHRDVDSLSDHVLAVLGGMSVILASAVSLAVDIRSGHLPESKSTSEVNKSQYEHVRYPLPDLEIMIVTTTCCPPGDLQGQPPQGRLRFDVAYLNKCVAHMHRGYT
jgi:hypothetical protein